MRMYSITLLCLTAMLLFVFTHRNCEAVTLVDLTQNTLPGNMAQNNVQAKVVSYQGRHALKVDFQIVEWPNVFFVPSGNTWNWSNYAGISIDIYNPEAKSVTVCLRVDNPGGDGITNSATEYIEADPKKWHPIRMMFKAKTEIKYWGMRGIPGGNAPIDQSRVSAFQIFLPKPQSKHTLYLSNFKLIPIDKASKGYTLPFVDRFGQNIHAEYPGKLRKESEWPKRIQAENAAIKKAPAVRDRDKFGGWSKGPKLQATGWFRTEKLDGKWWLVTPEGHLFFSIGVDTIHPTEATYIDGRDGWFDGLPDPNGKFKEAYGYMSGGHSMAEVIGDKGKTFVFYMANHIRKYGSNWRPMWRENVYKRLPAWGFNTIANWSDTELLEKSPMPFVATGGVGGKHRVVEGAKGYWGYIPDFFDPEYAKSAESSLSWLAAKYAGNKLCIGYFVDNEMAWETVEKGTLLSPKDQPCRIFLINMLKDKYKTIDAINKAWGINAADWDTVSNPEQSTDAYREDIGNYLYLFAKQYFQTVKNTLNKYDPNHLYMGCRFAWSHPQAIRACADVADVVSFNFYRREIQPQEFTQSDDLGKPIIIGEFHFGALDRGMLHTGLVPTKNQKERSEAFINYVKSVAKNPSFVGCHWFQYIDEPLTGRWFDGENYNIGMVDVTDTPYPELTSAAKKINAQIYEIHYSIK